MCLCTVYIIRVTLVTLFYRFGPQGQENRLIFDDAMGKSLVSCFFDPQCRYRVMHECITAVFAHLAVNRVTSIVEVFNRRCVVRKLRVGWCVCAIRVTEHITTFPVVSVVQERNVVLRRRCLSVL